MIYYNFKEKKFVFYRLKVSFEAHGEPTYQYDNDTSYWERFIKRWWHHTNLSFTPVEVTEAQQGRLNAINEAEVGPEWIDDLREYVEFGRVYEDSECPFLTPLKESDEALQGLLASMRAPKLMALAKYRYERETGGLLLPNGLKLATDRPSQAMLSGAYQSLLQPFVTEIDWKGDNGWVKVDMATIEPLAKVCVQHVQCCFSAERRVEEDMGLIVDPEILEEFDVKAEFDQAYQTLMTEVQGTD